MNARPRPRIALTVGEPAGIGPDLGIALALRAAAGDLGCELVCLADRTLLINSAHIVTLTEVNEP